ncbi:hypothetical protein GCM10028806_13990 [Spirosoma terrae]
MSDTERTITDRAESAGVSAEAVKKEKRKAVSSKATDSRQFGTMLKITTFQKNKTKNSLYPANLYV